MGADATDGTYEAGTVWRWFGGTGRFSGTTCAVAWCLAIRAAHAGRDKQRPLQRPVNWFTKSNFYRATQERVGGVWSRGSGAGERGSLRKTISTALRLLGEMQPADVWVSEASNILVPHSQVPVDRP